MTRARKSRHRVGTDATARGGHVLTRSTFRTSRLLDFCSEKELVAQTGHQSRDWPLVVVKELVDNALDACEEAGVAPEVAVRVDDAGITVADNGPGMPPETVTGILDFAHRVSSREAYVAPDRGAQGNALKTLVTMPFVLDGKHGRIEIAAQGIRHRIDFAVDAIRQQPVITHDPVSTETKNGTEITVFWPDSACSILDAAKDRFLQIADDFTWLNPHLRLSIDWRGERRVIAPTAPDWAKWRPSYPTCPHWYGDEHLQRLVAAYLALDADNGRTRTVREFVAEFRGLSGSRKQKAVLEATGLHRAHLSALAPDNEIDAVLVSDLLAAMKANTMPVKPKALGIIGKDHLMHRFEVAGCEMESFQYRKVMGVQDGAPCVIETAFGWCPEQEERRLVTGVNWSPGIINPFRHLRFGASLDTILSQQRMDTGEPVILVLHAAEPRVEYQDRGKSSVVIEQ